MIFNNPIKINCKNNSANADTSNKKVNNFMNNWKNYKVEVIFMFISLSILLLTCLLIFLIKEKILQDLFHHPIFLKLKLPKKISLFPFCTIQFLVTFL